MIKYVAVNMYNYAYVGKYILDKMDIISSFVMSKSTASLKCILVWI